MPEPKTQRGICPECKQERALTKSGHMRYHKSLPDDRWRRGFDCDGIGSLPLSVVDDPIAAAEARGRRQMIDALRDDAGVDLDREDNW